MSGRDSNYLKQIAEQKLKSFSIGTMGKRGVSRKEEEDRKRKEEEAAIGNVYKEFVDTFEQTTGSKSVNKTWVKAGTFNAGNRKETTEGKGQLYRPTSKLAELAETFSTRESAEAAKRKAEPFRPDKPGKKKKDEKKKSNLEMFKEELKAIQEERQERHKYKAMIKAGGTPIPGKSVLDIPPGGALGDMMADVGGDPTTTNLYLGNLSPKLTEIALTEMFGKFGPLASIKIMYPRTDDEKNRGKHCGFVAFMSRRDGERSLAALAGKNIEGFEMRMGWGKPVPIPLHPIYIPPALLKYTLPPTPSGLPFNCQPDKKDLSKFGLGALSKDNPNPCAVPNDPGQKKRFDKMLYKSTVKVVLPSDRTQMCLINRMVEFVIREGPIFEATIMNRELANPHFKFLFENQSPEHLYYRWRLFSILQGDSREKWSAKEFRMFKGGSLWKPPHMNLYTGGMPLELLDDEGASVDPQDQLYQSPPHGGPAPAILPNKRGLSETQRDRFEDMLRSLQPDRNPVAEAMVWCIEHADAGEEIIDCIAESLSILETPVIKKVARLFLISDILHNCSVKGVPNVSFFRVGFQSKLPEIFVDLSASYKKIPGRMKAEAFKQRVMGCFRAWEDWALYPMDYLIKLQNIFLGLICDVATPPPKSPAPSDDLDGRSIASDEDVDGIPLDGAALLKAGRPVDSPLAVLGHGGRRGSDSSLDGAPIEGKRGGGGKPAGGFVASKWETVDPEDVKAQAITTSKWDLEETDELVKARKALMGSAATSWGGGASITKDDDDDSLDGAPMRRSDDDDSQPLDIDFKMSEERRAKLRDIELKVMCYQDELESGGREIKSGWTMSEQVEHYRKKLLRKAKTAESPQRPADKSYESDEEKQSHSSRKERKRRRESRRDRSSSEERSRSREKEKDKRRRSRRSRDRSVSSSPERKERRRGKSRSKSPKRPKRSRSRSRDNKKHKKKRH